MRRLTNIAATGRACLLVDRYDHDWSALWRVRLDATARVLPDGAGSGRALAAVAGTYRQYSDRLPPGPVIALDVTGRNAWKP